MTADWTLNPASSFQVGGSRSNWIYELTFDSPDNRSMRLRVPADGIVHVRINADPASPWMGRAPYQLANLTASTLAFIERSLRDDSSIPTGAIIALPDGVPKNVVAQAKQAITQGKGGLSLFETTSGGFGGGKAAAPQADWRTVRFGATPHADSTALRDTTARQVLATYGVPHALAGLSDAGVREARRTLFFDVVKPLRRIIEAELEAKLNRPFPITFDESVYLDHQRLSRAFKTLRDAGMSESETKKLLGID